MGMAAAKEMAVNHQAYTNDQFQQSAPVGVSTTTNLPTVEPPPATDENYTVREWIQDNQEFITKLIANTSSDEVELHVKDLLLLMRASTGKRNDPPLNYYIANAAYEGHATEEASHFRCRFQIALLKRKWTTVKLFAENVALTKSNITYHSAPAPSFDSIKGNPFSLVALERDESSSVYIQQGLYPPTKNNEEVQEPLTTAHCIGVFQGAYCLIASQPGLYTVDVHILAPFASNRKTGVVLAVPKAAQNQIIFKVPEPDIFIKVDPSLLGQQYQVEEEEDRYLLSSKEKPQIIKKSVISCRFSPTERLSVQWTENMGTNIKTDLKVEVTAQVEQKILVSIGEGILLLQNLVKFKILSGQMSLFEVEVDPRIKIVNVEGSKSIPVKRWEVLDTKADKDAKKALLKVWIEYGIENNYDFTVTAEMELESTSCKVTIPEFSCSVNKSVSRDRGFMAVEALTNVEVAELQCNALDMIDISEIPDELFEKASNPLLFGYKIQQPGGGYELILDVKKHGDVGVLVAVVDSAHFTATYSEEGAIMYKLLLVVKNTQKQYLRIAAPHDAEIWTTLVSRTAVKPAKDDKSRVMIPLEKASKTSQDDQAVCSVEFIYLVKSQPLQNSGRINVDFPACDIPITKMMVSLFLPKDYGYGEFSGLKEVSWWTGSLPSAVNVDDDFYGGMPQQNAQSKRKERKAPQRQRFEKTFEIEAEMDRPMYSKAATHNWAANNKRGVKPVHVEMPTTGLEFKFEEILVTEKPLQLNVEYKFKNRKGTCGKRSV